MTYKEALEIISNGGGYILSNVQNYERARHAARRALLNRIGEEAGVVIGMIGRKADPNVMTYEQALHELTHARTLFLRDEVGKRYREAESKAKEALKVEIDMEAAERERAAAVQEGNDKQGKIERLEV